MCCLSFRSAAGEASCHGTMAPSASESSRFGMTKSGSKATRAAETLALRAGAVGAVETEASRLEFLVADLAIGAGVLRAEEFVVPHRRTRGRLFLVAGQHQAVAVTDGQVDRFGQAGADAFADDDAIDHGLDVMHLLPRQFWRLVDIDDHAIHPGTQETGLAHRLEDFLVFAFAAADQGRQNHDPRPFGAGQQGVENLLRRLLPNGRPAAAAACFAQAGVEQPQIIVDLGDSGHRAARVVRAGPLIDRDRRLQTFDQIDVGPFELMEELASVDREAFDILPLPFGIEGVEGQRTLAGAADTGEHHEPIAGQIEIEVLQVVHPRAANADAVVGRGSGVWGFPVHGLHSQGNCARAKLSILPQVGAVRNRFGLAAPRRPNGGRD